jgi:hypothetical protein
MALRNVHHSTTGRRPTTSAMYEPISEPIIWPALPIAPTLPICSLLRSIARARSGIVNEISEKSSPSKNVTSEQISSSRTWKRVNGRAFRNCATSSVPPRPDPDPAEIPSAIVRFPLVAATRDSPALG